MTKRNVKTFWNATDKVRREEKIGERLYNERCIAALKCRQRKKQWLNDLQARADFLAADNEQLQLHVCALRDEIIHLQTLLYAHRDCPVTQKQQRFAVAAAGAVPVQPSPYPTFQSMLHPPPQEETPPDLISGKCIPLYKVFFLIDPCCYRTSRAFTSLVEMFPFFTEP